MKVMIRVPNWVGDAVMAEPALRHLRRIFKDAHITFVARPWVAGLFEGENLYDEVIPVADAKGFKQTAQKFFRELRLLKAEAFDYAVLLTNSFGTALSARLAGIPAIAGYATDLRGTLLHKAIAFEKDYKTKHQVFYYLNIASQIESDFSKGAPPGLQNRQPQLHATAGSLNRMRSLLAEQGIAVNHPESLKEDMTVRPQGSEESAAGSPMSGVGSPAPKGDVSEAAFIRDEKSVAEVRTTDLQLYNLSRQNRSPDAGLQTQGLVALNPGATNSRAKQWLAERFAATADALAERDGFQTVIVGAEGDAEVAGEVAALMRTPVANLAGRTSIAELKAVLSLASLVISNDTGAAHVAAALGIPTVVVFGPTEDFATRPLADFAAVVRKDVECSPCMLKDCPIDHRCMTGVEVPFVYQEAQRLLALRKAEGRTMNDE
jgi:ADP-heptose:LPS heptosyltransferase